MISRPDITIDITDESNGRSRSCSCFKIATEQPNHTSSVASEPQNSFPFDARSGNRQIARVHAVSARWYGQKSTHPTPPGLYCCVSGTKLIRIRRLHQFSLIQPHSGCINEQGKSWPPRPLLHFESVLLRHRAHLSPDGGLLRTGNRPARTLRRPDGCTWRFITRKTSK
jgi:hypothetical protein